MNIFFTEYYYFCLVISCLLALAIGSFLNVVIYRLPIMLQQAWRAECCEFLQLENQVTAKPINLFLPRSRCPHCATPIFAWQNIPLFSFILLKGKCAHCKHPIAWRYPLVELLTAVLTLIVLLQFHFTWTALAICIFTWCLLVLTFIDFEHQLLPDIITIPLLWLGLLINLFGLITDLPSAVIGAIVGYLSLWLIARLFQLITGKIGMGNGDFKLLALLGAWLGWQILPLIVLVASLLGALAGIGLILLKKQDSQIPISFGPYLAIAGWLGLFSHNIILQFYNWLN